MAKILLVDDEPDMIWALTNVLLSENHSVISVNSGEESLVKVEKEVIDLVLLDFRLPGMDGLQVLKKIKEIKPELPVIMVTGYGGIEEAVESIKLGATHYLPKPFDNDQLVELVNKTLQMNNLKKEGVFGKRLAEKIAHPVNSPKYPADVPSVTVSSSKPIIPKKNVLKWAAVLGLIFLIIAGNALWFYQKNKQTTANIEYRIEGSKVSGLSWGNGYLWVSDWFAQNVQQYKLENGELVLVKTFPLPDYHITGITWGENAIYTCDSWKKMIYKHNPDNQLSVIESYTSPGSNPSGLFYDGKYLWSCDGTTKKIYQHVLDERLTVISTYDSNAYFPVGLYTDGKDFWCAEVTGKVLKYLPNESFKQEAVYVLPNSSKIPWQVSAYTMQKDTVWIAYEGVPKVFQINLKNLRSISS